MLFFSRAGLSLFVCFVFLSVVTSAPLPKTSEQSLAARSPESPVPLHLRSEESSPGNLSKRYNVSNETLIRRNIFKKIKNAFKKVGKGIKNAAKKVGNGIKKAAKKVGNGVKNVAKKVGGGIKKAAKKVGSGIKKAAKKVGGGIKKAAQKVGKGIKKAAQKVGKFVKTTGAKVAKFGLKVWSTAQSVAAKAAKFIPGVGNIASKALTAASAATNFISNKIPVSLGKKLDKGMKVMDKIRNPVGGAAGAVLNAFRRDDGEDEILLERAMLESEQQSLWARVKDDVLERELRAEFEERGGDELDIEERELGDDTIGQEERDVDDGDLEERVELDNELEERDWDERNKS